MNKNLKLILLFLITFSASISANSEQNVFKKVLDNGMTILVRRNPTIPSVFIELFYHVGSKDEQTNEKGLAHLLEHMVFKGTKEKLSETDIPVITHKLSGNCNAHTHYDWTSYEFELPSRHWAEALPILADCMTNCTFKQDLLNAEFKAVIQELKMGRDSYAQVLYKELISTIFSDHPYHYPVIGFKQDIWEINNVNLMKFYKKHYHPNNATLVIVGDVDPIEAFAKAEKEFGAIPRNANYKKNEFYFDNDIVSRSVTLYRDIKNPIGICAYVIPGKKEGHTFALDAVSTVLAGGASSRLYQKLVEEKMIVNSIGSYNWQCFDHGLFFIYFEPKDVNKIEEISILIKEEINNLLNNGITENETTKIVNSLKYEYFTLIENNSAQAGCIGQFYLITKDENYIFNYFNYDSTTLPDKIKEITAKYLRPCLMHKGFVLPAPDSEKTNLLALQEKHDLEDKKVLNERIRQSEVEPENYAHHVNAKPVDKYNFPKSTNFITSNGIKILHYENKNTPTVSIILELKASSEYDSRELPGVSALLGSVLAKGTQKRSYKELTQELESHAIGLSINIASGTVSLNMLSSEFEHGLEILTEILTQPAFNESEIEKERNMMLESLKLTLDNPKSIAGEIITKNLYKNHPYSNGTFINEDNVKKITKEDLINFYEKYITPKKAKISISGNISQDDAKVVLEKTISKWAGSDIEEINYPKLEKTKAETINYTLNRDQIVLKLVSLSIDRNHPDYDKLIIFNQILSGSLDSKLFRLREKTGFFYNIGGSVTSGSGHQPGMFIISTMVSRDNLSQAEELILNTLDTISDDITVEEVRQAKDKIISSLIFNYATNGSIASTLLFLDDYNFPKDYFDTRARDIEAVTIESIKEAVKRHVDTKSLLKIRVGRV
ncbi:MAG: pitrilysin family protein [Candidatus Babeliales bacterium]|nr:pitrilysin family protein [Candidatus Babeliales bacterium]